MLKVMLNPVFIAGWIIFSLIAGIMGSNKRMGFWGTFLASLVISPLISILFLLIFQPRREHN